MFKRHIKIVYHIIVFISFFLILFLVIALARGYRFSFQERSFTSTGIIAFNSAPSDASIYVDEEFIGVTEDDISLPPGTYSVRMTKDGYTDWSKDVTVRGEIVMVLDGTLFPINPSLSPVTSLGIVKAVPVGQTDQVLLFTDNEDKDKDGIFLFNANVGRLSLLAPLQTVILNENLPFEFNFETADVTFAPDFSEAIITFERTVNEDIIDQENTTPSRVYSYKLSLQEENVEPFVVTGSEQSLYRAWKQDQKQEIVKILETFPDQVEKVATDSFRIISFSPDETKILYQAINETEIERAIVPALIGSNQTKESRNLEVGNVYVYDFVEDKNYLIETNFDFNEIIASEDMPITKDSVGNNEEAEATSSAQIDVSLFNNLEIGEYIKWYPSSKHLVFNEVSEDSQNIAIIEYDGMNKKVVYSGPYQSDFFALNSNWKLYILANLNPQANKYSDLYEIGIR